MNTQRDLYIIGAGGFGREVAWLVERINKAKTTWNLKGFIDDNVSLHRTFENDYPVVGGCDYLKNMSQETWVVCAVAAAKTRKKIIQQIKDIPAVRFGTLVDPDVICSEKVKVGEGSIICAGTIITVNISIGSHNIINLDCTIGHDAVLHDFVTIYPSVNVSGNVTISECVELGTGMQIIQGKMIGTESIIGAGAVVVRDIPQKCVAVGSPAKPIKYFE